MSVRLSQRTHPLRILSLDGGGLRNYSLSELVILDSIIDSLTFRRSRLGQNNPHQPPSKRPGDYFESNFRPNLWNQHLSVSKFHLPFFVRLSDRDWPTLNFAQAQSLILIF